MKPLELKTTIPFHSKLSEFFSLSEFFVTNQAGGAEALWNEFCALPEVEKAVYYYRLVDLAKRLDAIRKFYGKPIRITSGWRSERVNKLVGGASKSYHLVGMAADIVVVGVDCKQVQKDWGAPDKWQGGLGYGKTFTHLDIRHDRDRFNY